MSTPISLSPSNIKLKDRAARIVAEITNCEKETAINTLQENGYKLKEAVLQIKYNMPFEQAQQLLKENNGILRKVFEKSN